MVKISTTYLSVKLRKIQGNLIGSQRKIEVGKLKDTIDICISEKLLYDLLDYYGDQIRFKCNLNLNFKETKLYLSVGDIYETNYIHQILQRLWMKLNERSKEKSP